VTTEPNVAHSYHMIMINWEGLVDSMSFITSLGAEHAFKRYVETGDYAYAIVYHTKLGSILLEHEGESIFDGLNFL
jgi:hypothetical protein